MAIMCRWRVFMDLSSSRTPGPWGRRVKDLKFRPLRVMKSSWPPCSTPNSWLGAGETGATPFSSVTKSLLAMVVMAARGED